MPRFPDGFDVEGPVQAEVFVIWLNDDHLELTGPDGPAPWLIQLGASDHPVEVVDRIVRDVVGPPLLVHSTSWRRDRDAVILSFVVVIDAAIVGSMTSAAIGRPGSVVREDSATNSGRWWKSCGADASSAAHRGSSGSSSSTFMPR